MSSSRRSDLGRASYFAAYQSPDSGRRVAKMPAEQTIEMRDVAEAGGKRNVDDLEVERAWIGQHALDLLPQN